MSITVNDVIRTLYELPERKPYTRHEQNLATRGDLHKVIVGRVASTKYRKSRMDQETRDSIEAYMERILENKQSLKLVFLSGGYKQSRLSSSPYPEWAEVFNISFALRAAGDVESVYPPGVEVIYRGDEVVASFIDNYRLSDLHEYTHLFRNFIRMFSDHIPSDRRVSIKYELTSETSPAEVLFPLMEELFDKYLAIFESLSTEEQRRKIDKSMRNYCWDGEKDLTSLTEAEKIIVVKRAAIMHDAFIEADATLAREYFEDAVPVTFRKGVPDCVHYGSCSSSTVQFWAGEGFINIMDDRAIPQILSYEQQAGVEPTFVEVDEDDFRRLNLHQIGIVKDFVRQ